MQLESHHCLCGTTCPQKESVCHSVELRACYWQYHNPIGCQLFTTPYLNYVNELGFNCMCNYTDDLLLVVPDKDEFLRKIPYVREFLKMS